MYKCDRQSSFLVPRIPCFSFSESSTSKIISQFGGSFAFGTTIFRLFPRFWPQSAVWLPYLVTLKSELGILPVGGVGTGIIAKKNSLNYQLFYFNFKWP